MKQKLTILALALTLVFAAVLAPLGAIGTPVAAAQTNAGTKLNNIPVTGALSDGGTFEGTLSITNLVYSPVRGLLATGTLTGTATDAAGNVTEVTQNFRNVRLNLDNAGEAACDILHLDLGPLNLDLLGLQVDLSQIVLDITAQPGPGNLLGNLLCSLAGLLDQGGPLNQIMRLITQINSLLR